MSHTPSTSTSSSSNFRTIFVAALKAYEKKTKTDLHTHPLATQLQSCESSRDILAVLQDKVNEFEQSKSPSGACWSHLVMGKFSSELRFKPELSRTEPWFGVRVWLFDPNRTDGPVRGSAKS
ncbi:hypothetical protein EDB85DRAFT_1894437 [Lactarius pseudohatsudake]|nr:hypothetical protein EDB85DRAFT_1894437 [Lactarius pseudohatsudake]